MINSKNSLPKISPIGTLLKEGLKIFLIILVYSIPSIIISGLIFSSTGLINIIANNTLHSHISLNTGTIYIFLSLIIWFISFLFISVIIPNMIENKVSSKSGFKISELTKAI